MAPKNAEPILLGMA